ncbi:helix-turn-helix domain-containing protein [Deinococcus ruber]|nr:helix-turn-helix transcriptional regulator [Deinococcus ruber]
MEQHDRQIGAQLRRLRVQMYGEMGSVGTVARDAGISIALLAAIERGERGLWELDEDEMTRLAQAYRLSPVQFVEQLGLDRDRPRVAVSEQPVLTVNLQRAIEEYGHRPRYAGLDTMRWIIYLSTLQFEEGIDPEPAVWAEIFLTLKQSGVVPGAAPGKSSS